MVIGWASPKTLLVIACISLFYLYPFHRIMRMLSNRDSSAGSKRILLGIGIAGLVALLVLFKLYRHFTIPWLGGSLLHKDLLALVGFSYFIFRAVDFLHIQAIVDIDERYPWAILFYTLFPPTITSGPIQKFLDFRQQLDKPVSFSGSVVFDATYRITRGFFRKVVIAYLLNNLISPLLAMNELSAAGSLALIVLLYFYFYFDFAGYSDIAIGFGLLLGIKVPENFRKPFLATNVSEFWRNWHITLVDWFRDHVFIPMGGMKKSRLHASILALFIMILCGLWHGITVSFVVWGFWHGSMLFAEGISGSRPLPPARRHGPIYWARILWTNARVALGAVLFLPDNANILKVFRGFAHW